LEAIGGPIIKPGFTMKGKIRVLGLESDCSVDLKPNEVSFTNHITAKAVIIRFIE
jgi:hypothetical protein